MWISNNSPNFIIYYNLGKKMSQYTYIYTKCNDIFRFEISIKLKGVKTVLGVPTK